MECDIIWNGDVGFEVQDGPYGHTIDLRKETCTCRSWQLKGIPCAHAICALQHRNLEPTNFIAKWYHKETYLKTYSHFIQPIPGMRIWQARDHPPIKPPPFKVMPGRPKRNRRKHRNEPQISKKRNQDDL